MCSCRPHERLGQGWCGLTGRAATSVMALRLFAVLFVYVCGVLALGVFIASSILANGEDPSGFHRVALSDDPTLWNGQAGDTFARNQASASWVLSCLCCALILGPFMYSFVVATSLASAAATKLTKKLEEHSKKPDPPTKAQVKEVGFMVQELQQSMLEPLKDGWERAVNCFVFGGIWVLLCCIPLMLDSLDHGGDHGLGVTVCGAAAVSGLLVLTSLAQVTTQARGVLLALNEWRTIGHGSERGFVNPEIEARIKLVENYLLRLNDNQGP